MVNKKIKYVLYVLMIISLFLSIKSKVNASSITYEYNPSVMYSQAVGTSSWTANTKSNVNMNGVTWRKIVPVYAARGILLEYGLPKTDGDLSFTTFWEANLDNPPTIVINSNGKYITCENSQMLAYGDRQYYNHYCKGYVSPGNSYNSIIISFMFSLGHEQMQQFAISNYMTIIGNDNSNITNAINNQSQQQHNDANNINNSIKDTNNTIKDSSTDTNNMNSTFDGLNNNMASNNTISQLLLMPVRLLQKLLNAFSNGCSAINTGEIFGYELVLPCIDLESLLGSVLWNVIDVIGSGALAYAIGKKMIKIFNQFTNLKEGGLESAYD